MGKAENTKQLIVEKSAELFNKFGYDGCSLSDIMKATNLKKGGIYNHFKSKDEIAFEAFDYSLKKVFSRFRARLDNEKTAYDKVMAMVDVYASFARNPVVKGGCPIFNTAMDAQNSHPELKQKARDGINLMRNYLVLKLEEGERDGEFHCLTAKQDLATMIVVTLEGAIVYSAVNTELEIVDLALKHVKSYLSQNIKMI